MDTWIWIVIAVAVVVVIALVVMAMLRKRRRSHLQDRFGPEYGRAVDDSRNRRTAERELKEREARHDELQLRPLSEASRQRYTQQWSDMQSGFVDRPQVAVADADRLITDLMRERGYPVDDFDTRSELVSVDHPDVVQNYRTAHSIAARNIEGRTSTEDLRQAVISYRALFEEMIAADGEPSSSDASAPTEREQPRVDERR
jgi:FtsZ-interacting cell division protein ZipA